MTQASRFLFCFALALLTANGAIAYTLDKVSNRLSRSSSVPSVPSAVNSYDSNDRLTSDTYDANGNTISALSPSSLNPSDPVSDVYNFENRLIRRVTTRAGQSLNGRADGGERTGSGRCLLIIGLALASAE